MQVLFVIERDRLVGDARRQGGDFQRSAPPRFFRWEHAPPRRNDAVEMIEDGKALDQHLAAVENQRRHPEKRVIGPDLLRVSECRPRLVLIGDAVEAHGYGDPAHEGGIVLADKDHHFAFR